MVTCTAVLSTSALLGMLGYGALMFGQENTAQDWTVLGILGAVVVGIGSRMVVAVEKNTQTLAEVTTSLKLLLHAHSSHKEELRDAVERIPCHKK